MMIKSFIRYEFTPSERLILLRGLYLLLSNIMEDMYFFGFYDDDFDMEGEENSETDGEDNEEDSEDDDESNFFEDNTSFEDNFNPGMKNEEESNEEPEAFSEDFEDDFDDFDNDDDSIFNDDWNNERYEMEKMVSEIKVLENKLINYKSYDKSPELGINELELLLHSAHEVKLSLDEEIDDDLDPEPDSEDEELEKNLTDAINNMPEETKKQLEDDFEEYIFGQHRELGELIDKINDWIDNYQINSN